MSVGQVADVLLLMGRAHMVLHLFLHIGGGVINEWWFGGESVGIAKRETHLKGGPPGLLSPVGARPVS